MVVLVRGVIGRRVMEMIVGLLNELSERGGVRNNGWLVRWLFVNGIEIDIDIVIVITFVDLRG